VAASRLQLVEVIPATSAYSFDLLSEDTNNPIYKLTMTENLQLDLINVLMRSIFEHKSFTM